MKVLCIGIHIDDCEVSVGGTTLLLAQQGADILYVNPKPYLRDGVRNPSVDAQSMRAAEMLSAKKIILDYDETKYYRNNERTVRALQEIICDYKPDIVFTMHPKDNHIGHVECAITAREALFAAAVDGIAPNEVYTYECSPNQTMLYFNPDFHINITSVEEPLKKCLMSYAAKGANGEWIWREKRVRSEYRGLVCSYPLAEGFKILKFPERNNGFLLHEALKDHFAWNGSKMYYTRSDELR